MRKKTRATRPLGFWIFLSAWGLIAVLWISKIIELKSELVPLFPSNGSSYQEFAKKEYRDKWMTLYSVFLGGLVVQCWVFIFLTRTRIVWETDDASGELKTLRYRRRHVNWCDVETVLEEDLSSYTFVLSSGKRVRLPKRGWPDELRILIENKCGTESA